MPALKACLFLLLALVTASCHRTDRRHNFYHDAKRGDLWRVPLLDPYELVSPTNSDDWFFIIPKPKLHHKDYFDAGGEFQLTFIDSIGISGSSILLKSSKHYWPKLGGQFPTTVLVDAGTNRQYIFSGEHHRQELRRLLDSLGIQGIRLHSFEKVKREFQERNTLPADWKQ